MTTRVTPYELFRLTKLQTSGSDPCHNFDLTGAGFNTPENFERSCLAKTGERGVVGVVGAESL